MSDADYEAREKTLRNHVKKQREIDPNFKLRAATNASDLEKPERPETPKNVSLGFARMLL
jgi:hypothetical protein